MLKMCIALIPGERHASMVPMYDKKKTTFNRYTIFIRSALSVAMAAMESILPSACQYFRNNFLKLQTVEYMPVIMWSNQAKK